MVPYGDLTRSNSLSPQTAMHILFSYHQQPRELGEKQLLCTASPRAAMERVVGAQPCSQEICKHKRICADEKELAQKSKCLVTVDIIMH